MSKRPLSQISTQYSDSDSESSTNGSSSSRIIILLDDARLETVKTRKGDFELLNCDDHRDLCRKWKKVSVGVSL